MTDDGLPGDGLPDDDDLEEVLADIPDPDIEEVLADIPDPDVDDLLEDNGDG